MEKKLIAIVPAAGIGARAAGPGAPLPLPKQYRPLKGEPMLRRAVKALLGEPRIGQVRVAVAPGDAWVEAALSGLPRTVWSACGGPSRADTVRAAIEDAGLGPGDWVLVHDAARPGLPAETLARLIDQCLALDAGGLLALPVADTVKRAAAAGPQAASGGAAAPRVGESVPRDGLWLAQTPQMFPAGPLLDALRRAAAESAEITDEASALERLGVRPLLVPGSARNFKVTWPEDFDLMEKWL
ncbi:MAG: 2-C-methyl-D-erythritol 4-phosphate cytidylyltransferase [Alcaligenaceae bacterium]|nr:2-C-methyl-D-erythritol 4-phosphate cytidylyltransferase [Alcaligenaceae bacterium]